MIVRPDNGKYLCVGTLIHPRCSREGCVRVQGGQVEGGMWGGSLCAWCRPAAGQGPCLLPPCSCAALSGAGSPHTVCFSLLQTVRAAKLTPPSGRPALASRSTLGTRQGPSHSPLRPPAAALTTLTTLDPRVVLTAAHCVIVELDGSEVGGRGTECLRAPAQPGVLPATPTPNRPPDHCPLPATPVHAGGWVGGAHRRLAPAHPPGPCGAPGQGRHWATQGLPAPGQQVGAVVAWVGWWR